MISEKIIMRLNDGPNVLFYCDNVGMENRLLFCHLYQTAHW